MCVIRLAVSVSTCPAPGDPASAPLWVAADATENPTRRANASSPSGPYISPAGSAKTATDAAGIVSATPIIVQPRPTSPRLHRHHTREHPDRHRDQQQARRLVTWITALAIARAISPITVSQ